MTARSALVNIARETAISIAFNMAFTAAFFAAMFGFSDPVPIGGAGGLAADFLPQSFMVALMGGLVPSLIVRAKLGLRVPSVAKVVVQSFVRALLAMVATAAAAALLVTATGSTALPPMTALLIKLGFAAVLAAIVTPLALKRLLREPSSGVAQSGNPT